VGAAVTPVLLPLLFGEPFREAVGMALILLAAAVPFSIAFHLAPALAVMGFPGVESWGQAAALLVTVAALPLVVPHWGGEGAAVVSLAAYSVNCAIVIGAARRRIGGSLRSYLVVSRRDMAWLAGVARPGAAAA
jgi:O-antigen/teichoic acid export membrane protein